MDASRGTLVCLSYYPLQIFAREWMMYLEVMFYSIKQHEYAPSPIPAALKQVSLLNTHLIAFQAWARRSMATSFKIQDVINFLEFQKNQGYDEDRCNDLIEDYQHIASRAESYSRQFEATRPIITSLIQIIDSQQSLKETANIARLTYLALVFLPLSYVSGLLSMNDHHVPAARVFGIYVMIAIPLCVIVFLLACPPLHPFELFDLMDFENMETDV